MIASLCGKVGFIGQDHLIIETNGIGFLVYAPRPVLDTHGKLNEEIRILTILIVRDDSLTLYGFATPDQRHIFETLLSISGVGPRVALQLLSAASPDDIRMIVSQKDTARLVRVPGIGKKMAERLLLELKNKLELKDLPAATSTDPSTLAVNSELIALLTNLGYSTSEAQTAVAALPPDAPLDLEERLRLVLRSFGSAA